MGWSEFPRNFSSVWKYRLVLLASVIVSNRQINVYILLGATEVFADPLAKRLQRLKPISHRGRVDPNALRGAVVDPEEDRWSVFLVVSPARPLSRKASRHRARVLALTPSARGSLSSASPRSSLMTASRLHFAENRHRSERDFGDISSLLYRPYRLSSSTVVHPSAPHQRVVLLLRDWVGYAGSISPTTPAPGLPRVYSGE